MTEQEILENFSHRNLNLKTKYYNSDIHKGAFMLPQYVKDMLNENE